MDKAILYETIVRRAFPNIYIVGYDSAAALYRKMLSGFEKGEAGKREQDDNVYQTAGYLCSAVLEFKFRCNKEQGEEVAESTFESCLTLLEHPTLERINKCMNLILLAIGPVRE